MVAINVQFHVCSPPMHQTPVRLRGSRKEREISCLCLNLFPDCPLRFLEQSSRGRWNDINRLLGEDPADGVFEDGEGERDFEFLEPAMGEVGTTRRLLSAVATVLEAPVEVLCRQSA